jgi:cytochrome c553
MQVPGKLNIIAYMKRIVRLTVIIILAASIPGCYYDKEVMPPSNVNSCDTTDVQFSVDIHNILVSHGCLGCHTPPGNNGGVVLSTYAGVSNVAGSGRLLRAINWTGPAETHMPKDGAKLSDCEIAQVAGWINQGQKNN